MHYLLAKPELKTRICLFAHSKNHGAGKNTLTDFLINHVIGSYSSGKAAGLESLTQKHNTILQAKKLIVINECSATRDSFKSSFDKIKSMITDNNIIVEPKGIDSYQIKNLANFIILTNHLYSLYLENDSD